MEFKTVNNKMLFWLIIFTLLTIPLVKSFFIGINKLFKETVAYNEYKKLVNNLEVQNKTLKSKINYYKSSEGLKSLVKERLDKVEKGELLIKVED